MNVSLDHIFFFSRRCKRQPRTCVVELSKDAKKSQGGGCRDYVAVFLLFGIRPGRSGALHELAHTLRTILQKLGKGYYLVRPGQMDIHDHIPILILHILQARIYQDCCIIIVNINTSKTLKSRTNNSVSKFDAMEFCTPISPTIDKLFDDWICSLTELNE